MLASWSDTLELGMTAPLPHEVIPQPGKDPDEIFPLTTGSPGNGTYLGLRYREDTNTLPFTQFFFKMELDSFTDIYHQLIESFPLRENIDSNAPAAPVFAIRINFKFDEHRKYIRGMLLYSITQGAITLSQYQEKSGMDPSS